MSTRPPQSIGHGDQTLSRFSRFSLAFHHLLAKAILIFTSMVGAIDPAELSIASVLMRPPLRAYSMRPLG